jgi:hypothetical protein
MKTTGCGPPVTVRIAMVRVMARPGERAIAVNFIATDYNLLRMGGCCGTCHASPIDSKSKPLVRPVRLEKV